MKYAITTLGCKVNQFETQAIETMLAERGFVCSADGDADVVIVNTCAVTAESGRKSRQAVRRLKSENPGAAVAVCGCFSQLCPEELDALGADIVCGSGDRRRLVSDIEAFFTAREKVRNVDDPFSRRVFEPLPPGALEGRTRAYLKIQDGCDNFCSYCVIPYARGGVRSLPAETAAAQAGELAARGYREIVVTGIEIASYGKDLRDGTVLADVVESISSAAPEARLRLGSLEPTVVTEEFCRRLAACGNVCPHFHLSLQSGCDRTLSAMCRRYDTARFFESAALLRTYFPGCALTADMICGFPGETEEDHAASLAFIRRCAFSSMHIFPYSARPGTRAAAMDGQLPRAEKERRAHQAKAAAAEMQRSFLLAQVGRTLPVLFENENGGLWHGHADNYVKVAAPGQELHGQIREVRITAVEGLELLGSILPAGPEAQGHLFKH